SGLRPIHVSAVIFWILLAATGAVYKALDSISESQTPTLLQKLHLALWWIALIGIFYSYFTGNFGGREYWEYPPVFAILIGIAWLLFLIVFFKKIRTLKRLPVYV